MPTTLRARGVTLLELMIAMAVTIIVIAGAIVVIRSQQKAYADGQRLRGAQTAARRALLAVEQTLPSAGLGMDGALAFDFRGWTTGTCPSPMDSCPGDTTANADELVFFARDPAYWVPSTPAEDPVGNAWLITGLDSSKVSVKARAGDMFRKGQIFLAVCSDGSTWAYFTAAETKGPLPAAQSIDIALQPAVSTNPFNRQDLATTFTCLASASGDPARLFLINRYRFHLRPVQLSGGQYDGLLVLDRGVDMDGDGDVDQDDEVLVAEGIESFQVGYLFANPAIPMAGATAATAITFEPTVVSSTINTTANRIGTTVFPGTPAQPGDLAYLASSFYPYADGSDPRQSNQQANLMAVRVSVLARSTGSDIQGTARASDFLPLLNQSTLPAWVTGYAASLGGHDGFQRVVLDTTVGLPNMTSRAMTYF